LALEDFWSEWSRLINRHTSDGVYGQWLAWRLKAINSILTERLVAGGISEDMILAVVNTVFESRASIESLGKNQKQTQESMIEASVSSDLRSLAHVAIEQMSEKDLRQLWLPLGSIFDATRHH